MALYNCKACEKDSCDTDTSPQSIWFAKDAVR